MGAASVYGVVSSAGTEIALPASELQEVVGWPTRLLTEPGAPPHARGLFNLRGSAVPLLDLRCLVDAGAEPTPKGMVAILGLPNGQLGLVVDGIADVVRAEARQVQALGYGEATSPRPLWSAVLAASGGQRMIRVLDSAALISRPGVALLMQAADAPIAVAKEAGVRRHALVVRACGRLIAFDIGVAREIVAEPRLETFKIQCALLEGMIRRHGQLVPIINLGCLLGFPESDSPLGPVLVLEVNGWQIGLPIREVVAMPHYRPFAVTAFEGFMLRRNPLLRGLLACDGASAPAPAGDGAGAVPGRGSQVRPQLDGVRDEPGTALLLDHEALFQHPDIGAACRLLRGLQQAEDGRERSARRGTRADMLLFAVGEERFYIKLADVQELVKWQADWFRLNKGGGAELLGAMRCGGAMVPLVSLRALMGQPEREPDGDTRVLLVRGTDSTLGFVVDRTESIERVVIRNDITLDTGYQAEGASLIKTLTRQLAFEAHGGHQPLPLLDLPELARRMDAMPVA